MPNSHTSRVPPLLATALLVAGCIGQPSPPPTQGPTAPPSLGTAGQPTRKPPTLPPAKPTPVPDLGCDAIVVSQPSPGPDPTLPPAPNPKIADPDARSLAAVRGAAAKLAALHSYQFSVDVVGVNAVTLEQWTVDFALRGTINRSDGFAMDTLVGTQMREFDNSAGISSTGRWVVSTDFSWAIDNLSGVLEPSRRAPGDTDAISALIPDGLAGRFLVPFAGGYRLVGKEKHGGVMTQHFRASPQGAAAYAKAIDLNGKITADLWIGLDGGYLAGAKIAGKGSHRGSSGAIVEDVVLVQVEVTHPNDPANLVALPTPPLPDPVRQGGPPVDLRLEYEVMRSDVRDPTTRDVQDIGVTLRRRLGISTRPVQVAVGQPDKIVVTVCGTTHPQDDRRLIVSKGGLTVVPLPASEYGSTTKVGPKPLPAAGGPIDPELEPVAPPARIGIGKSHVDPTTGRRGVAFGLENHSTDLFVAYAKEHPGEYVAIVLNGTVLATLPVDDKVAVGDFAFTGDYTEAEARLLVDYLYADPLLFELRLVKDLEIPASR
jgi:SecD-like export protein